MFNIANNGYHIVSTDFWKSEYNQRGLAFLSVNANILRLLIPTSGAEWRDEMETATKVTIEPSLQLKNAVDVVFEDGTDSPFFISIIESKQCDCILTTGNTRIIVYFSLNETLTFRNCKIV